MKIRYGLWTAAFLTFLNIHAPAATLYVSLTSTNPVSPYADWSTAATNIQDAVDASTNGDLILVTNGIYQTGGRIVYGSMSNRVAITKAITVESINGPLVTVIQGSQLSGSDGKSMLRCVYLTNGATFIGFTLTNGSSLSTGDVIRERSGGGAWMPSSTACISNCIISGNQAREFGGGVFGGTALNCVLVGNTCLSGGGASSNILINCAIIENSASQGGAAYGSSLNHCTVTANSANSGGGVWQSVLDSCLVYFNTANDQTTNYSASTFNYCCTTPLPVVGTNNISADPQLADLIHISAGSPCRGAGNPANTTGTDIDCDTWLIPPSVGCDEFYTGSCTGQLSAVVQATYTNVVSGFTVFFTGGVTGHASSNEWDYGDGTTAANLLFSSHTWTNQGDYPVVFRAFNNDNSNGVSATVMIHVTTNLVQYVNLNNTNPVAPYSSWYTAATNVQDAINAGGAGGTIWVTNGTYSTGIGSVSENSRIAVLAPMTVQSVNGTNVTTIDGGQSVCCAYLAAGATLVGFTLTNGSGGGVVCASSTATVSNCVMTANTSGYGAGTGYGAGASGGTLYNCLLIGNTAALLGGGADGSTLYNCTLKGNTSGLVGGGATGCTLNNCAIVGNVVNSKYGNGNATAGGAYWCTLNNCLILGNRAYGGGGGGTVSGTLNNCVVAGNEAVQAGGTLCGTLNNCVVVGNWASYSGSGAWDGTLNNCIIYYNSGGNYTSDNLGIYFNSCCTTPLPSGLGNITNEPLFVSLSSGDYHLQSNSPCINSGNNAYVTSPTDLDGNPRIVGGTVDMGAYEYQTPVSQISYAWLQQYGLPITTNIDTADLDGTGFTVYQDWIAGLNPTNALSVLAMLPPVSTNNPAGLVVSWESVSNRTYFLQSSTNLGMQPAFSTIQSNIIGQPGTTSCTDTSATNAGPYFYRVGVQQ